MTARFQPKLLEQSAISWPWVKLFSYTSNPLRYFVYIHLYLLYGHDLVVVVTVSYTFFLNRRHHSMRQFSEKSDVYSFGVVLLEVITGQPVISRPSTAENRHISDRVSLMLSKGDIKNIVDPRLGERFNAGLASKITEVALACASQTSATRLTMSQVVAELKDSLCRAWFQGKDSQRANREDGINEFGPRSGPSAEVDNCWSRRRSLNILGNICGS